MWLGQVGILFKQKESLLFGETLILERKRGNSWPSFPEGPAAPSLASGLSALEEGVFVWLWLSSFSFPGLVSYCMSWRARASHRASGSRLFQPEPLALIPASLAKAGWGFEKWHWLDAHLMGAIAGQAPHPSPAQNETDSYTLLVGAQTTLLRGAPSFSSPPTPLQLVQLSLLKSEVGHVPHSLLFSSALCPAPSFLWWKASACLTGLVPASGSRSCFWIVGPWVSVLSCLESPFPCWNFLPRALSSFCWIFHYPSGWGVGLGVILVGTEHRILGAKPSR